MKLFTLLPIFFFIFSCSENSEIELTAYTELGTEKNSSHFLSIESTNDGNGAAIDFTQFKTGETITLHALMRDNQSGRLISKAKIDWDVLNAFGTVTIIDEHTVTFTGNTKAQKSFKFLEQSKAVQSGQINLFIQVKATKFEIVLPTLSSMIHSPLVGEVKAVDQYGNLDDSYNDDVSIQFTNSATGAGVVDIINGRGSFTIDDSVVEASTLTLHTSLGVITDISSTQTVSFSAQPADRFVITQAPDVLASANSSVIIQAQDPYGNKVINFSEDVDLSYMGSSLIGTSTIDIVNGEGTINLSHATAQTVNLTLANPQGGVTNILSTDSFIISPGPAAKFTFDLTADVVAAQSATVTIRAQDSSGNNILTYQDDVTIEASGTIAGDNIIDIVNGVGSVVLNTNTAGLVNLSLKNSAGTITDLTDTDSYNINAAAPNKFIIVPVSDIMAGQNATVNIQAQDAYGNISLTYQDDITLESTGLITQDDIIDIVNGVGSVILTSNTTGTVNLALKTSVGTIADFTSTDSFIISTGAPAKFILTPALDTIAGQNTSVVIEAQDALGNLVTTYQDDVTLVAANALVQSTVIDIVNGTASINLITNTSGTVNLSLSTSTGSITDLTSTDSYIVSPDTPNKFDIIAPVAPYYKGVAKTYTVEAQDVFGNLTPIYQDDVDLNSTGALVSSSTIDIVNGVGTVSLTATSLGALDLTLSTSTGTIADLTDTLNLTILLEPANHFTIVSALPATSKVGDSISVIVEARNSQDEMDFNYQTDVTVRNSHGTTFRYPGLNATDIADNTCAIVNGTCTVSYTSSFASVSTITLRDNFSAGITVTGTTANVTWTVDVCDKLSMGQYTNETIIAGQLKSQPIYAWDTFDNQCDEDGTIDIALTGALIDAATITLVDGAGSHDFTPTDLGTIQAVISNSSSGLTNFPADPKMFYVLDSVADDLDFQSVTSSVTAGDNNISMDIQAKGAGANTTKYNGDVEVTITDTDNGGAIIGTLQVTLTNGFGSLTYQSHAAKRLTFTVTQTYEYTIASLPAVIVTVNASTADRYAIVSATESGLTPMYSTVEIEVHDQYNNPVTGYNDDVSLNVDGSAAVTGGNVIDISNGKATVQVTNNVIETVTASLASPTGSVTNLGGTKDIIFGNSPTVEFSISAFTGKSASPNPGYVATISVEVKKGDTSAYSDYYGQVDLDSMGDLTSYNPTLCGGFKQPACPANNFSISIADGVGSMSVYSSTIQTLTIGLTNSSHGFDVTDTANLEFIAALATKFKIVSVTNASVGSPASVTIAAVDDADLTGNVTGNVDVVIDGNAGEFIDEKTSVGFQTVNADFVNQATVTLYFVDLTAETVNVSLTNTSGLTIDPLIETITFTRPDRYELSSQPTGIAGENHVITVKALKVDSSLDYDFDGEINLTNDGAGITHIKTSCASECPNNFVIEMDQGVGRIVVQSAGAQSVNFGVTSVYVDVIETHTTAVAFDSTAVADRFFIDKPQGVAPGDTATVTVKAVDQNNDVVPTYQDDVTLGVTGDATGAGLVNIVNGIGTIDITNNTRETITLSLSGSVGSITNVSHTTTLTHYKIPNETCLTTPCATSSETVSYGSANFVYVSNNASTISDDAHFEDFDNDGLDDVLLVRSYSFDQLFSGNNSQESVNILKFGTLNQVNASGASIVADFNNDNNLDFAVFDTSYNSGVDSRGILNLGDGLGDFPTAVFIDTADTFAVVKAEGVDIDNDGDMDIVTLEGNEDLNNAISRIKVHLNDGAGNFTPSYVGDFTIDYTIAGSISFVKYDKDNFQDISISLGASISSGDWNHFYLINNGSGTDFTLAERFTSSQRVTDQLFTDINNDGFLDRISSVHADQYLVYYYTEDMIHKDVVDPTILQKSASNSGSGLTLVMDVNSDNNNDILTCLDSTDPLLVLNDDPGLDTWIAASPIVSFQNTGSFVCNSFRAGDYNGDGKSDLLIIDNEGKNIVYFGE